ncbi:MAG: SGNH/GDSL hydrolase family protein [Sedimentisphaerales bacterium]|nr:SGNH/GDSL hydrolase family protein [Sedimentisphaerales bacterium]
MKKIFQRLFLILIGVVLGLLTAEGSLRLFLLFYPSTNYMGKWEFRAARPVPYKDADYFGKEFLDESMRCITGIRRARDANFIIPGDFTGKYFNIKNGKRHTCHQPSSYKRRVLLFGGSTVFSQEVPDEHTIASYLQMLFLENGKDDVIVENYGTVSMIASQQTERLLQTPLNPDDVVIFYDGTNDVIYPVYYGNAAGWLPGRSLSRGTKELNWLQRRLYPLCLKYSNISAIAKSSLKYLERKRPITLTDSSLLDENLKKAGQNYKQALIKANDYVTEKKGEFYHFLQPCIFTLPKHSKYEKEVIANTLQEYIGMNRAFAVAYPQLKAASDAVKAEGVKSFDLTDIFDQWSQNDGFYLDSFHVNHVANKRIADFIYEIISENDR